MYIVVEDMQSRSCLLLSPLPPWVKNERRRGSPCMRTKGTQAWIPCKQEYGSKNQNLFTLLQSCTMHVHLVRGSPVLLTPRHPAPELPTEPWNIQKKKVCGFESVSMITKYSRMPVMEIVSAVYMYGDICRNHFHDKDILQSNKGIFTIRLELENNQ